MSNEDVTEVSAKGIEAAKKALEAITAAVKDDDAAAPQKDDDQAKPPEVEAGLDTGARAAVERFRKSARWIVGAFAAVGVVVFGSLPFADITGAGRNLWQIIPGLIVSAIGISLTIWGVSRVDEPEDASLGELEGDLSNPQDSPWNPSKRALYKLSLILQGDDGRSHVGPMYPGVSMGGSAQQRVSGLIKSIGQAQTDRYQLAADVAEKKSQLAATVEDLAARTRELDAAWTRWSKVIELSKPGSAPPQTGDG